MKMDEEKKTQETEDNSKNDNGNRVQQETTSLLDRADNTAKRIEEANRKAIEVLEKHEKIMARDVLGGKSERVAVEKQKETSPEEYANKIMKGEVNPLEIE